MSEARGSFAIRMSQADSRWIGLDSIRLADAITAA